MTTPGSSLTRDVELRSGSLGAALGERRVFLGAAMLDPGRGGIARVARLTGRVLMESGADLEMLSLHDRAPAHMPNHTVSLTRGKKLAFAAHCYLAAARHRHYIYDSVGIARAHPRLPGLARPYAVWMHGIEVWDALKQGPKRVLQRADLLIVNSRYTRDRYSELHSGGPEPIVCWLATEDDDPPLSPPDFSGPPTVLILARLDASEGYKGHAELIRCWSEVVAAVPDARLLIAGGGSGLAALEALAAESRSARSIDLLGFVEERELHSVWKQAHIFAMPSRGEGFGLVYAEAMRHGLPIIASAHDAGREVNVDGVTGYNVDLDRKDELPGRIVELLSNEALMREMGGNAQARWRQHFRYSNFRERLSPILAEFLTDSERHA